ncbi:unnamed protein product [Didymodactylos carnosus]|uniref:Uncharacterized protein n=1 Tax=Didymodactylos carnosus TaxID=1234261 RepID=A0A8S2HJ04_9BILA|nr:unnamed protein product [Didymodactylos carnosus]CAF3650156.1 unnamed protein product [Didymodactylos carnosus]
MIRGSNLSSSYKPQVKRINRRRQQLPVNETTRLNDEEHPTPRSATLSSIPKVTRISHISLGSSTVGPITTKKLNETKNTKPRVHRINNRIPLQVNTVNPLNNEAEEQKSATATTSAHSSDIISTSIKSSSTRNESNESQSKLANDNLFHQTEEKTTTKTNVERCNISSEEEKRKRKRRLKRFGKLPCSLACCLRSLLALGLILAALAAGLTVLFTSLANKTTATTMTPSTTTFTTSTSTTEIQVQAVQVRQAQQPRQAHQLQVAQQAQVVVQHRRQQAPRQKLQVQAQVLQQRAYPRLPHLPHRQQLPQQAQAVQVQQHQPVLALAQVHPQQHVQQAPRHQPAARQQQVALQVQHHHQQQPPAVALQQQRQAQRLQQHQAQLQVQVPVVQQHQEQQQPVRRVTLLFPISGPCLKPKVFINDVFQMSVPSREQIYVAVSRLRDDIGCEADQISLQQPVHQQQRPVHQVSRLHLIKCNRSLPSRNLNYVLASTSTSSTTTTTCGAAATTACSPVCTPCILSTSGLLMSLTQANASVWTGTVGSYPTIGGYANYTYSWIAPGSTATIKFAFYTASSNDYWDFDTASVKDTANNEQLVNGDFNYNNSTGWTLSCRTGCSSVQRYGVLGSPNLWIGCTGTGVYQYASQTFSTVPCMTYRVSYQIALYYHGGGTANAYIYIN